MSTTARLLKREKEYIVQAAVKDAIDKDRNALDVRENALIEAVVLEFAESKKLSHELEVIKGLNSNWLDTMGSVRVYVGQYVELKTHSAGKRTPLLPKWLAFGGRFDIDARSKLGLAISKFVNDQQGLTEREETLKTKVTALVGRASTANALAELWPEGEAYWKKYVEAAKGRARLPVVSPREVNSLLGIPKEEQACA